MKQIYSLSLAFFCTTRLLAQQIDTANVPVWIDMMQDRNVNFFETQKAFETYWEGREIQKGDGWKVFKRWENHWKDKVNPDGTFPPEDAVVNAFHAWRASQTSGNSSGAESITGDWVEIGPLDKPENGTGQPNGNGRLNAICFHPTSASTFWVGAPAGGLWKTTDGGQTWSSNTDALPTLGVSSILVDPGNTNVMYIGTGDRDAGDAAGLGVYKSTNGGSTWSVSNSGMGTKTVGSMVMHPTNSSIILAATSGGIYRTTNAGSSWSLVSSGLNFKKIVFKPGDPNTVYASEVTSGAGFYKSTDNGQSWTEITTGLPTGQQRFEVAVSPADASVVYVLCTNSSSAYQGLYKSTNSGTSFNTQSSAPNLMGYNEDGSGTGGQGWYDLALAVDPSNASIVYVGGVNIWKSSNSGVTSSWDCVAHWVGSSTAASVHADQHWLEFSPVNGHLYACNDGGIYYTSNGGTTWPELSAGLGIAQIYKIGVSALTHAFVINGYQDNGTAIWDDTIFRTERGGDGMESVIDYSDDQYVYASIYYGNIVQSTDGGYSMNSFAAQGTNGITESGGWITPYTLDRVNPNIMFIGYKNVWRTMTAKSGTVAFTAISNNLAGSNSQNMRQLRQSKVNSNRLFALRGDNKLFRTDNALSTSPTWTDLTSGLPGSGTIYDIETSPTDNNVVWITRGAVVWKSTNGGTSWSNYSTGLSTLNKYCLVADPLSDGGLYVGSDAGVYYIDNSMSSWVSFFDGLPLTSEITELEIYHPMGDWQASRIRAGTYGRGLWESDLYDPENIAPMAFIDMDLDSTDICSSDTISLFNNSAYGVTSSQWTITPSSGVSYVAGTSSTSMNPKIRLSQAGSYTVKLVVSNSNGSDSITVNNAIVVSPGLTLPFFDDLENNLLCAAPGCQTNCQTNQWKNITNGQGDNVDWRPDNQGTPWSVSNYSGGGNTGPSVDYNPGTSNGIYFYLSSYPPYSTCYNQIGILESPCLVLDSVNVPEFSYAYHRYGYGPSYGPLKVDVRTNGSWTTLWTQTGQQGDQWMTNTLSLNNYIGQSIKLRFVGQTGTGWQSDMAIDGIEVTAAPFANFSASDTLPCLGTTIVLNDQSTQNPTSWNWTIVPATFTFMNGTTSQSQNPQIKFNAAGSYTISLIAANAYGNDLEYKIAYITAGLPSVTMVSNAFNDGICEGDTLVVGVSESLSNYAFYLNGTMVQNGPNDSATLYNTSDDDDVWVIGSTASGCANSSDTLHLSVHENPTALIVSSDADLEICEGDTVVFTASGIGSGVFDFYRVMQLEQSSSSNQWGTAALVNGNEVWVEVTDTNLCSDVSDTLLLSVLPIPPTPSVIELQDSLESSILGEMYKWQYDFAVTTQTGNAFPKQGLGSYRVRIFEAGCWSLWSDPLILTGIKDGLAATFRAYPTPASDKIIVEFSDISLAPDQVRIYSASGALVMENHISKSIGNTIEMDIRSLSEGAYTLCVQSGSRVYSVAFIKERE